MRARVLFAVTAVLLLGTPSISFTTSHSTGDLSPRGNPDGVLNAGDILILQRILLGEITPTAAELLIADVAPLGNPDGVLNAGDLVVLQRAVVGLATVPDSEPPPQADVSLISVSTPVAGQVQVAGNAGSVEGGATVQLINFDTGSISSVVANGDGSFNTAFNANTAQVFSVSVSDVAGNTAPSASMGVGQILTLAVTSPADGASINGDRVQVTGTYSGPPGTAITVNGHTACSSSGIFYANNIPLEPGANTLTVIATMLDGLSITHTRLVTSTAVTPVTVTADTPCGYAPHAVEFSMTNDSGNTIQQIDADYDGDGSMDFTTNDPDAALSYTYAVAGVYQAVFTITDQLSTQYNLSQTIVISDTSGANSVLQGVYNDMLDRLRLQAVDGALNHLTPTMQDKFRSVFQALGPDLPTVVDQLGSLAGGRIGEDLALYRVVRDENGTQMAYSVYFVRGNDGVWRIGEM